MGVFVDRDLDKDRPPMKLKLLWMQADQISGIPKAEIERITSHGDLDDLASSSRLVNCFHDSMIFKTFLAGSVRRLIFQYALCEVIHL
jgi:hypothetical protein